MGDVALEKRAECSRVDSKPPKEHRLRVLIADDHDLLRDTLVLFLKSEDGKAVQAVGDLDAAHARIAEQALEAGAAGFAPETLSEKSMVNADRFMAMGEQYAPIGFMTAVDDTSVNP